MVLLAGAIALAAPDAGTVSSVSSAPGITTTVTTTVELTGQQKIALSIAKAFSVTVGDVMAVRNQDMGWGEVYKVFRLAQLTGKSTSAIVTLSQSEGWGEIFRSFGLKPGQGRYNLGQTIKGNQSSASNKPATVKEDKDKDKAEKDQDSEQDTDDKTKVNKSENSGRGNNTNSSIKGHGNSVKGNGNVKPNERGKGK